VLKNRALRFIKDQAGSALPFFMLIAPKAPHGQLDKEEGVVTAIPSPSYARAFADTKLPTTPALRGLDPITRRSFEAISVTVDCPVE
jgi:hypothetical protein